MEDNYLKLCEKLDKLPIGFPESEEAIEILKVLFTPEEAALALRLPVMPKSIEELADELGEDKVQLKEKLDIMADKGTVFTVERKGKLLYRLLPSVVGFSETPFWPGKIDERAEKLGPLWTKYWKEKFSYEIGDRDQSMMRVVPIERSLSGNSTVTPFEDLAKLLEPVKYFAVAHCPCRQYAKTVGKGCDHTTENCLHFDSMGQYIVEHGMAREITREETLDILRKSNEEGLVHMTENHQGKVTTICNCCSCCCVFIRTLTEIGLPNAFKRSNYVSKVDPELCTACETCAERCPVEAITVDDIAVIDEAKCIGCGVCYPSCPSDAITLERRPDDELVEIADRNTWAMNVLKEKGLI